MSTQLADLTTTIAASTTYQVEIARQGSTVKAHLAGRLVATADSPAPTAGRRVGFGTQDDGATFDDLTVTGTPAATHR